ncbi:MAG: VCBS repeat-containing protein [Planctomycetes bacterium]|nr:VCBS repeat-containing protein [Planctomycetota bacterium]
MSSDGNLDVVVVNTGSDDVAVLLGNGSGALGQATKLAGTSGPASVAIGDVNGDGDPDLAVANWYAGNHSIFAGNGAGGFGVPTTVPGIANPIHVVLTDPDGDGFPDLVASHLYGNCVTIARGNGSGAFGAQTLVATGAGPYGIAAGDLDGDAAVDLAVAARHLGAVSILLNECPPAGCGSLASVASYGVGKPGSGGIPQLQSVPPKLGFATSIVLSNAVPGPGVFIAGLASTAIPFDGGTLLVTPDVTAPVIVPPGGSLAIPIVVPVLAALCGVDVYFQALVFDASAGGLYGTAQSPGLHWTIGN